MLNLARRYRISQTGVIAVEFALIFPFMVVIWFGTIDLAQFISVNRRVAAASGVVADLVTANDLTVSNAQITDYYNGAYLNLKPIPAANVRVEVYNFRGGVILWSKNNGNGPSCGATPTAAQNGGMASAGNDLIVTRVCTNYVPMFGRMTDGAQVYNLLGLSAIKLTKTVYQRPRLNLQLNLT